MSRGPGREASLAGDRGISDDASMYEDLVSDAESADPLALESRWLYKQGSHVFGPVPAKKLLELLYEGRLDGDTPICPEGDGEFMELRRYGAYRAHLPKAEAHQAEVEAVRAKEAADRRAALKRRILLSVAGIAIALGGALGTIQLVRRQRADEAERIRREKEERILAEIEQIQARVRIEPELVALVDDTAEKPAAPGAKRGRASARRTGEVPTGELTQTEVLEGLGRGFPALRRCIVEQIQRDAESVPPRLVLAFTIDNEGAIKSVNVDDRILRRSPLLPCFEGALAKVRYRKYKGEVQNVEYPINIAR